jgi:hypothetical protein
MMIWFYVVDDAKIAIAFQTAPTGITGVFIKITVLLS